MPTIPLSEYAARRAKVREKLGDSIAVLFSGEHVDPLHEDFHAHPHFIYLTGITDEPGAMLLLDPTNPSEKQQEILILRPLDPELEKWDGLRMEVSQQLRDRTGFQTILRYDRWPRALAAAAGRSQSLACLHPLANHTQPVSPDLTLFRKLQERMPGIEIIDDSEIIAEMRAVKSENEVAMIQRAIDITARGFEAAMTSCRPGMNEFELQETIEHTYRSNGSRDTSFGTIVGSGINATVLHYRANEKEIEDGDLIVIDSGAMFGDYRADVTRTLPANGRFTDRQREIYEIVLQAQLAAIDAVRPGVHISEVDKAARSIINEAGFGDYFIHGIGHHLGLETHDITPAGNIQQGNVLTIEPGIYLPDEAIGVRIEEDVLVTANGVKVLTEAIPKAAEDVEQAMSRRT